ncbi:hypothetical protein P8625_00665 [Tenacibaculum tangerinum]|uniref:Baseplate protein J-like domain-containing protein n=1 Tax=Tenacibaculum tangerinum TaxID=3038772 RepID=A0ABY8L516_9FLAO|nr:hypothetical protein [Tenacibaculum tangerinum]WGH75707.1 hypothetical protein P8625_00665 [Tenacibaculum tangerinum]
MQTSIHTALLATQNLVDGRTEMDYVYFLTEFASLINFYDESNRIKGNWSPFLLKDPLFLLGTIAKTPFKKLQEFYVNTLVKFEKELEKEASEIVENTVITNLVNSFFSQVTHIFQLLDKWIGYMLQSSYNYHFKEYVLKKVKETYSVVFWALIKLQEQWCLCAQLPIITSVNWSELTSFNKPIWIENKGKYPYWEVFNLKASLKELLATTTSAAEIKELLYELFKGFKAVGDTVFSFLYTVISGAKEAYFSFKKQKNKYPDTMLLRTFSQLLQPYTSQINSLANKHLDFYYQDILRQESLQGTPDSVVVTVDLLPKKTPYMLPKNTLFTAGLDAYKNTILFQSEENVWLNPATITNAYTLTKSKANSNNLQQLYLASIPTPSILKKDKEEKTSSWATFGSRFTLANEKTESMALVIASPMLLAKEGVRIITVTLSFTETVPSTLLQGTTWYLSTQSAWYEVSESNKNASFQLTDKKLVLTITLQKTAPPIVPFAKETDGIKSNWAMLKIVFTQFTNLTNPPKLKSLQIAVAVQKAINFELYNDFGALAVNKPFQPLGPTPEKEASFVIGNKEAFSKPISTLGIDLEWGNLPEVTKTLDNFSNYYQQYNKYLEGDFTEITVGTTSNKTSNKTPISLEKFTNTAFKVQGQLLQNGWMTIPVNTPTTQQEMVTTLFQEKEIPNTPEENNKPVTPKEGWFKRLLAWFNLSKENEPTPKLPPSRELLANSNFSFVNVYKNQEVNATIQTAHTIFSEKSTSGYIRLQLTNPTEGFGNLLYPQVVNAVALSNANAIAGAYKNGKEVSVTNTPKAPFIPTVNVFTGSYTASKTYYFEVDKVNYGTLEINLDQLKIVADMCEISMWKVATDLIDIVINFLFSQEAVVNEMKSWLVMVDNILKTLIQRLKAIIEEAKGNLAFQEISADFEQEFASFFSEITTKEALLTPVEQVLGDVFTSLYDKITSKHVTATIKNGQFQQEIIHELIKQCIAEVKPKLQQSLIRYSKSLEAQTSKKLAVLKQESVQHSSTEVSSEEKANSWIEALVAKLTTCEEQLHQFITHLQLIISDKEAVKIVNEYIQNTYITPLQQDIERYELAIKGIKEKYPLDCFYKTPFATYQFYESSKGVLSQGTVIGNISSGTSVPLYPSFSEEGQLFIEMNNLSVDTTMNLFFELERQYTSSDTTTHSSLTYYGLGTDGWEELTVVSDTTNNLVCSGMVTLQIPSSIGKNGVTMPRTTSFWISVATNANPDVFAKTVVVSVNGVLLKRSGNRYVSSDTKPELPAKSITSLLVSNPKIASVNQPFKSFGGSAYESKSIMKTRVSNRIRTKGRCVTPFDFYTQVQQNFTEVFYTRVAFNKKCNATEVFVVKKVADSKSASAFVPMVSECVELKIATYLKAISSPTSPVTVTNFKYRYVKVSGTFIVHPLEEIKTAQQEINAAMNVFLSPWIETQQAQIEIDTGVNASQISSFVKGYTQITEVKELTLQLGKKNKETGVIEYAEATNTINPLSAGYLLVPSLNYDAVIYTKW